MGLGTIIAKYLHAALVFRQDRLLNLLKKTAVIFFIGRLGKFEGSTFLETRRNCPENSHSHLPVLLWMQDWIYVS